MKLLREAIRGPARRVGHPDRAPTDNDKFARTFFGENVQRAVARNVRAAEEKLRRLEAEPHPAPARAAAGCGRTSTRRPLAGRTPLVATGLTRRYGGRAVLDEVDLDLRPHSRVVITGANGAGKSTLLRILARRERPDAGAVAVAPTVVTGYLDQEGEDVEPDETVFEAYRRGLTGEPDALRAGLIRYGFFRIADVGKRAPSSASGSGASCS